MNAKLVGDLGDRERQRFIKLAKAMHLDESAAVTLAIREFLVAHAKELNH
jgi:hypothetical protein